MRSVNKYECIDPIVLKELFPITPNRELATITGWNINTIRFYARKYNLTKTKLCRSIAIGKTIWTVEMDQKLRDNYFKMTNRQLADLLGLKLTIVRMRTRYLGLQNYKLEYWTAEQTKFLRTNYESIGDTEIAEILQKRWTRDKKWTRKHVKKKRDYLKLFRTADQVLAIISKHTEPGGRSYTIRRNSASSNLPDRYVANCISRDPEVKPLLLKYPEIISLKRSQLQLSKSIKQRKNG